MYLVCVLLAWCAPTNLNAVRFQTHIFRGFGALDRTILYCSISVIRHGDADGTAP